MHSVIIVAVCVNIVLSLAVAETLRRRYRRCTLRWQRLMAYGCVGYALTRAALILPPFAADNEDATVLLAVAAETVLFLTFLTSPTRRG